MSPAREAAPERLAGDFLFWVSSVPSQTPNLPSDATGLVPRHPPCLVVPNSCSSEHRSLTLIFTVLGREVL